MSSCRNVDMNITPTWSQRNLPQCRNLSPDDLPSSPNLSLSFRGFDSYRSQRWCKFDKFQILTRFADMLSSFPALQTNRQVVCTLLTWLTATMDEYCLPSEILAFLWEGNISLLSSVLVLLTLRAHGFGESQKRDQVLYQKLWRSRFTSSILQR